MTEAIQTDSIQPQAIQTEAPLRAVPAADPPVDEPVVRYSIYWRETEPVVPSPPLEGAVRCDVAIIGGGYTGLWTAHFLKLADPSLSIHVVEAEFAGAGASGHNDGFMTPTIGHSLHTVVKGFGVERAQSAYKVVGRSILELRRFCRRYGVDAELQPGGFYLVATSPEQRRRLESDAALALKMGTRYELLDTADAQDRIGSPAIQAAISSPGATLNPHKLARGLLRVVRQQGVHVHEQTRALQYEQTAEGHVVTTPFGRITADKLVLATNAYQQRLPGFGRQVKPIWSHAIITEPLTDEQLAQVNWPGREGFVEARNFIVFARQTADRRLLIGGGTAPYYYGSDMADEHIRNDRIQAELVNALGRYFPPWRDVRITHSYGGCIAVTRDLVPHVGASNGIAYAYGYCGNGITVTHTTGQVLRDLVLERESEYTDLLFVRGREPGFPPEPLSYLGSIGVSALLSWQDRNPGRLKRALI